MYAETTHGTRQEASPQAYENTKENNKKLTPAKSPLSEGDPLKEKKDSRLPQAH